MSDHEKQLADALRKANALARGLDVQALLPFTVLKESEQKQWLDLAAAATSYGVCLR